MKCSPPPYYSACKLKGVHRLSPTPHRPPRCTGTEEGRCDQPAPARILAGSLSGRGAGDVVTEQFWNGLLSTPALSLSSVSPRGPSLLESCHSTSVEGGPVQTYCCPNQSPGLQAVVCVRVNCLENLVKMSILSALLARSPILEVLFWCARGRGVLGDLHF